MLLAFARAARQLAVVVTSLALGAAAVQAKVNETDAPKRGNGLYIVRLAHAPVSAYTGGVPGLKATKPAPNKKIDPNNNAVIDYSNYLRGKHDAALAAAGGGRKVYSYVNVFNGFAAELSEAAVDALRRDPNVLRVEKDQIQQLDTFSTPGFLGIPAGIWQQLGGPERAGENVIVGVIDSGVWPENDSFSDRDFTDPHDNRVVYQQIPGWNGKCEPGEAFPASLCGQKLIGARYYAEGFGGVEGVKRDYPYEFASARDTDGHGTHTSSTAAGNYDVDGVAFGTSYGRISGMAPRARIAMDKACWARPPEGGCSGVDTVAAIDQAVADGVDVFNYSISGTATNFIDAVEVAFLFAADAGVFVAASAGNTGPGASTSNHPSPWLTTVAASTHDRGTTATVTLGNGAVYPGASIGVGAGPASLVFSSNVGLAGANATEVRLCFPGRLDPALVAGKIVLCDRGTIARIDKSLAVQLAGGVGMVLANTSANSLNADLHVLPTVHIDHVAGAAARAYAQTAGATATLSAVDPTPVVAPVVAAFSSRGPSRSSSDVLKPDITAPGVDIFASYSPAPRGANHDFLSGTSMSSPHIAGIAALLKHAYPAWTPMMIKSAIMTTASQLMNNGAPIPGNAFEFGAGHVAPSGAADPGLVYNHGFNEWLGFLCGTGQLQASYCPLIKIDPSDLNLASITVGELAGSQTVRRTVRNVGAAGTYNASVSGLPGLTVAVTPSSLTLAKGQSATYQVTFSSTSAAALNAYAFGALTWTDGTHSVRSPLTVRPVPLSAPAAASSTGGAISIPVVFGYDGVFGTTARGLVAANTTPGNVVDDPANDINVALASGVGITVHPVVIPAGTTLARFSLFDANTDGADDLDLYVFNSTGTTLLGSSGSGTSAEEVNLVNPAAQTVLVVVHGWQTEGPDSNYTLFNWNLGTANAGNMAITAPSIATTSGTANVGVSFSGLSAGAKYLGAVDYNNGTSAIGSTVIRVDP